MVSRFFTNPKWDKETGSVIEHIDGDRCLWRHKQGCVELWENKDEFKTSQEALQRCLDAVDRGNWVEVDGPNNSAAPSYENAGTW